ncbi:hypothetical protein B0J13DRAFT_523116 [Dactylonectria estremocensis]|uniref:Uncharacterized protein n=1 Tax=Dactylonectria estremocensis TaxID=1079267 RepID=A0A9P9F1U9_9HYPO|nr:hypothetical protein B0J13DRAFT_523116 [Dactylonectria estremocensis]
MASASEWSLNFTDHRRRGHPLASTSSSLSSATATPCSYLITSDYPFFVEMIAAAATDNAIAEVERAQLVSSNGRSPGPRSVMHHTRILCRSRATLGNAFLFPRDLAVPSNNPCKLLYSASLDLESFHHTPGLSTLYIPRLQPLPLPSPPLAKWLRVTPRPTQQLQTTHCTNLSASPDLDSVAFPMSIGRSRLLCCNGGCTRT